MEEVEQYYAELFKIYEKLLGKKINDDLKQIQSDLDLAEMAVQEIETLFPLDEESLDIENQKLELYFKHIETLEEKYSKFLEIVKIKPFD